MSSSSDTIAGDLFPGMGDGNGAERHRPVLVILDRLHIHQLHVIDEAQTTLGRSPDCTLELASDAVSRVHARIDYENRNKPHEWPVCTLRDLASRNGTFLNGTRLKEPALLTHGARLVVANIPMVYQVRTQEEIDSEGRMREMATQDALTGLLNRGALQVDCQREIDRAVRYGRNLSILMIDIDDFKKINDTFGHPVGDVVLQQVARTIATSGRSHDLIARYGGEEFLIVLPETNNNGAVVMAERLRRLLENLPVQAEGVVLRVTVSIGIASLEVGFRETMESLLHRADMALLEAKRIGKNCIRIG